MRFIVTARPGPSTQSAAPGEDAPFDEALFMAYMKYNEDLHRAGVLVASEGLNPASKCAHVINQGGKRVAVDGPFAETKELLGGFYLFEVKSLEEAVEWALRCPVGFGSDDVLEIRQLTGEGDLPREIVALIERAAPTWAASWQKSR